MVLKFNLITFYLRFLGYTLEAQKSLFDNIRPLFANKPLIVIANKKDVWSENLTEEKKAIMTSFETELVIYQIILICNWKFTWAIYSTRCD